MRIAAFPNCLKPDVGTRSGVLQVTDTAAKSTVSTHKDMGQRDCCLLDAASTTLFTIISTSSIGIYQMSSSKRTD